MRKIGLAAALVAGLHAAAIAGEPALAATKAAPAAIASTAGSAAFQVVRTGDHEMSCPALAAEINDLATADQPTAALADAAPAKKKHGLGILKVLSTAAPFIPGVGAVGSVVGGGVLSAASMAEQGSARARNEQTMDQAREMARRAMAGPSPQAQRKERLTDIFESKHC